MFDFEYHLKNLPDKPGVYIMKNSLGGVIYVGKAKNLKNRVRQYFRKSKNHSEKVKRMVANIAEFEYIITDSEVEALILECNLIKKHRPKYNVLLKDDKSYPMIKITLNEDFPRVLKVRNMIKDGAKYFGPYPEGGVIWEILSLIKKVFPVRLCKKTIKADAIATSERPCLNYHMGLCKAPCSGYISKKEYRKIIDSIIELLLGKNNHIMNDLKKQMEEASQSLEFEKAASIRDKIIAINKIAEKQKIISSKFQNEDYINLYKYEGNCSIQVFFVRNGKVVGRDNFMYENIDEYEKGELVKNFIQEFYGGTAFIPKEIIVPAINDKELLEQWLTIRKDIKVSLKIPLKGEKKRLLELVGKNAELTLEKFKLKYIKDKQNSLELLEDLREMLNIEEVPHRIEAYDISNIQGVDSVGSMVVFEDAKAKPSEYRRFKIKSVVGPNDYESMREILGRRFKRGFEEIEKIKSNNIEFSKGKFCVFPDLLLMDGGLGQVNVALEVIKKYNLTIPVCGMVKDDKHRTRAIVYNNIEIDIKKNINIKNFITRVQDEVHRFAITYHKTLRKKRILHSVLDDIPNIGNKRKKQLLKKFGSIDNIKTASFEELIDTPSMDKKSVESIKQYFGK